MWDEEISVISCAVQRQIDSVYKYSSCVVADEDRKKRVGGLWGGGGGNLIITVVNDPQAERLFFHKKKSHTDNKVQCNNSSASSFYSVDIPMVSAVLGACQDVAGPCSTHPFPPRARWLTKTQQASEPKRPAVPLPSVLDYCAIPIVNKSIQQLEIKSCINFGFNEHLLCSGLICAVTCLHPCSPCSAILTEVKSLTRFSYMSVHIGLFPEFPAMYVYGRLQWEYICPPLPRVCMSETSSYFFRCAIPQQQFANHPGGDLFFLTYWLIAVKKFVERKRDQAASVKWIVWQSSEKPGSTR